MKDIVEANGTRSAPGSAAPGSAVPGSAASSASPAPAGVPPGGKRADAGEQLAPIWARHRVVHLFLKLTIYYCAVTAFVAAALTLFPGLSEYMPIGGAKSLIGDVSKDPFTAIETAADRISTLSGLMLWIAIAITGAVLTILPVSWTYMSIRKRSDYDQSLVETIMILPIAVTSLVTLVHTSLALAFGLTGIVAVVRFRNTLKSTGDALYVLVAIGIGLSAGVGAMEIAIVMSLAFNYLFLILWITDYGSHRGTRRYMRRARKSLRDDKDEDEDDGGAGDEEE
jgi:Domain of unknown function (DUF4956)